MKQFPEHFRELETRIIEFLQARNKGYRLWDWALKVPLLDDRLSTLVSDPSLSVSLQSHEHGMTSVLDLGCGLCMYWPFFYEWGFRDFWGIDLFSKRGLGTQEYKKTALELASTFCPDATINIVEGDVRDIDIWLNENGIDSKHFDLIFTKNTNYQKLGSTGIPKEVFDPIVGKYLKEEGLAVYAG